MKVKWMFCFAFLLMLEEIQSQSNSCTTPDRQTGSCVAVRQCSFILEQLKAKPISEANRQRLQQYTCQSSSGTYSVCCPESDSIPLPPDISRHRNLRLLDGNNCGTLSTDDRIINGNLTAVFQYPWMALLAYSKGSSFNFECSGSLINKQYVLTAAHCVKTNNKNLAFVRLGEHDVSTKSDCNINGECAEYQDFKVAETTVHPGYTRTRTAIDNDIALIRLEKPATLNDAVTPICLPTDDTINRPNFLNKNLTVTGWGVTESFVPSKVLLKANLPYRTLEECKKAFGGAITIDYKKICVGGLSNVNAAVGDSGGPLQSVQGSQATTVQYGIVSFGASLNQIRPSVFTRVSHYMDWILDNIKP